LALPFSPFEIKAFSAAVRRSGQFAFPGQVANKIFFPKFTQKLIRTSGTVINTLIGGGGPPLLLLHGYPETHFAWHRVANQLAQNFTVVLTDLRGYGDSGKPCGGPDHIHYSKREMGLDQIEVMRALGFRSFQAVGHDRGGRVLYQMLLDHPSAIEQAVVLDIVTATQMYDRTDQEFATRYFWWFYLIQSAPLPECMIEGAADRYLRTNLSDVNSTPYAVTPEAYAEYYRCFQNPASIHGTCEDYRASASIDRRIEEPFKGYKIQQPLLALWGEKGTVGQLFDVTGLWRERASQVSGFPLPCGHLIPEEDPQGLLAALNQFLVH